MIVKMVMGDKGRAYSLTWDANHGEGLVFLTFTNCLLTLAYRDSPGKEEG
jgi:hypothetical protein